MGASWGQRVVEFKALGGPGNLPIPGNGIKHNVGSVAETIEIEKPAGSEYVVVRAESGNFRIAGGRQAARTFAAADVVVASDTIETTTSPDAPHGYQTGDGPLRLSGASLPGNTAVDTDYWVYVVDEYTLKLCTSQANAVRKDVDGNADPIVVDLVSQGSGTFLLGGDQGSGNDVGFTPASAPTADATRGGTIPLIAGEVDVYSGRALTLRSDGAYVLTWWGS